ncbi:MAG TPA: hypothetical protein VFW11_16815 [Cyclobacteriaceae bacterium]|nr:hypothetical protein [Cyclobacteriaceae bacterium]
MKTKFQKTDQSPPGDLEAAIKEKMARLNNTVNSFFHARRKIVLVVAGIFIACLCGMICYNAIYGVPSNPVSLDKITLPEDIFRQQTDTTSLTPIGKMKGEIDGEFEAFHLAVDKDGQLYINRDPEYSEYRYDKSKGWEPITRKQLQVYEKELHFTRHHRKSLKP